MSGDNIEDPAAPVAQTAYHILSDRAYWRSVHCRRREKTHHAAAHRWRRFDNASRWPTALAAGLTSVSLFADSPIATGILSMVVVALTTLRAAFDPTEKASRHYEAAEAYADLGRKLSLFRDIRLQHHILRGPEGFQDRSFAKVESDYAEMDDEVTRLNKTSIHLSPEFIDRIAPVT